MMSNKVNRNAVTRALKQGGGNKSLEDLKPILYERRSVDLGAGEGVIEYCDDLSTNQISAALADLEAAGDVCRRDGLWYYRGP